MNAKLNPVILAKVGAVDTLIDEIYSKVGGGSYVVNSVKSILSEEDRIEIGGEVWLRSGVVETPASAYPGATVIPLATTGVAVDTSSYSAGIFYSITFGGGFMWAIDSARAIHKLTKDGASTNTKFSVGSSSSPRSIAYLNGHIYILDISREEVRKFTAAGVDTGVKVTLEDIAMVSRFDAVSIMPDVDENRILITGTGYVLYLDESLNRLEGGGKSSTIGSGESHALIDGLIWEFDTNTEIGKGISYKTGSNQLIGELMFTWDFSDDITLIAGVAQDEDGDVWVIDRSAQVFIKYATNAVGIPNLAFDADLTTYVRIK